MGLLAFSAMLFLQLWHSSWNLRASCQVCFFVRYVVSSPSCAYLLYYRHDARFCGVTKRSLSIKQKGEERIKGMNITESFSARICSRCFTCIYSFNHHSSHYPHFTDGRAEALSIEVAYPKPHSFLIGLSKSLCSFH